MKTRLRDGSGDRHYRYTFEDTDRHGNVRVYFRRKGQPLIRLREKPGTAEFEREYQAAYQGSLATSRAPQSGTAAAGTMQWLCQQYFASAAFLGLDDSTRRVRRRILDAICERVGTFRYAMMEPQHVAKLRDEKSAKPEAANSYVKALRVLFGWACLPEYRHARENPAKVVSYLRSNNPGGHKTWSEDDVAKYEARHPIGTKARLALDLFLYTGVRISDAVKLGPQMERPGPAGRLLVFTETKGRNRSTKKHEMPIVPPLRASIDATVEGATFLYLQTSFGNQYSVKGFGNWFKRRCREAGVDPDLSAHGLRKCGAVRCVDNGATEHQLMALYGWTTTKQAAVYTRNANRKKLEGEAAPFLERWGSRTK